MIKKIIKKILKLNTSRIILCLITANYVKLVYYTSSWKTIGFKDPSEYIESDEPFIVAFWHGRLLMLPFAWNKRKKLHLLISMHNDGELISRTVGHLGLLSVRGSTNKKGAQAIRKLVKYLKSKQWAGISPDGPHGPRMIASEGIAQVSRLANVPIFPLTYSSSKSKTLNTWDKFLVPFPFGKGVFIWGKKILPPKSSSKEDIELTRELIEKELNYISGNADEKSKNA